MPHSLDISGVDATFQHFSLRVLEDGLTTEWNAKNPTRAITAGDRILEVNGEVLSPEDGFGCKSDFFDQTPTENV